MLWGNLVHTPQVEKARMLQQRPITAKIIFKKLTEQEKMTGHENIFTACIRVSITISLVDQ